MTKENTAQETAIELLKEVRAYHFGKGRFNFSGLPDHQRSNEAFDAWMDLFSRIENCLASSLSEQKWSGEKKESFSRVEVINHNPNEKNHPVGRVFVSQRDDNYAYTQVQDNGRTLKVFIEEKRPTPPQK